MSAIVLDLARKWIDELRFERNYSDNTIVSYQRDFDNFIDFLTKHNGETPTIDTLKSLKTLDFRAWLANRIENNLSARSNVRAISSVKSFFHFLAKIGVLELQSIHNVRRPKLDKLLPKPIETQQVLDFLKAPYYFENDEQWITNRDRALYTLLYSTGLRINEALNLRTDQIASEMKITGKGKKDRVVILFPITLQRIDTYIRTCPHDLQNGFLFVGLKGKQLKASYVDNRLSKLRLIHDLPDHASAHAFRHSFASHLVQEGADLRSVQELLGHESLSSTQIYTEIDDYNLLKIYEKTHPLEN